jgi:hypothetical protein
VIRTVVVTLVIGDGRGGRVDTRYAAPRPDPGAEGADEFARPASDIDGIVSWTRPARPGQFGEQSAMPTEKPY